MKRIATITGLCSLLLLIPPEQAHAACERAKRVIFESADCLVGRRWQTKGFLNTRDHVQVKSLCPEWGKVVVKVDVRHGTDSTWTLSDGHWKNGSWLFPRTVKAVSCCSDLSDLCSRSDVLNIQGCEAEFKKSPASRSCSDSSFGLDGHHCIIRAACEDSSKEAKRSFITVYYPHIKSLVNCNGKLKLWDC